MFGVRNVTKGLERGNLSLVLVCRTADPPLLTRHLIALAAHHQTRAACLPDLSLTLAPILGLKSLIALGVCKDTSDQRLQELTDRVCQRIKPLTLPWHLVDAKPSYVPAQSLINKSTTTISSGSKASKRKPSQSNA